MKRIVDIEITGPDAAQLAGITRLLVGERLAACGSVSGDGALRSIYRWKGEVRDESEAVVTLHTREALVSHVYERVVAIHPYEVPGYRWRALEASPAYHQWVLDETVDPQAGSDSF